MSSRNELDGVSLARAVLDVLPDHIYVKDLRGRYVFVNRVGLRERNLERLEDIVGKTAHDLLPADVAERMAAEDRTVIESGQPLVNREAPTSFASAAGAAPDRWHITIKMPMPDAGGRIVGVIGVNRDISDRKRAELALRDSEAMFRAIFDQAAVGIALVGLDMRYMRVNSRLCEMLGYSEAELVSMSVRGLQPPESAAEADDYSQQLLSGRIAGGARREKELTRKDGSRIWVAIARSLVRDDEGRPRFFLSVIEDISEMKKAADALRQSEERLRQMVHFDTLTNLPNRALFHDRLSQSLTQAARNGWNVGLMFIDLDQFKRVNDTLGHAVGDALLKEAAARLARTVRSGDTVGRLGGDEFAVILNSLASRDDATVVAEKIIAAFKEPVRTESGEIVASVSIGISVYPADGSDNDVLLQNADAAMYRAKAAGRGSYRMHRGK